MSHMDPMNCNILQIKMEFVSAKIYKHFYTYMDRITLLQNFGDKVDVETTKTTTKNKDTSAKQSAFPWHPS